MPKNRLPGQWSRAPRTWAGSGDLLARRDGLHEFVEGLYDFWRRWDRFLVVRAAAPPAPGDKLPWTLDSVALTNKPFGVNLTILEAGNDNKLQAAQVEQCIRLKPDMVILNIGTNDRGLVEEYQREVGALVKFFNALAGQALPYIPHMLLTIPAEHPDWAAADTAERQVLRSQ